MEYLFFTGTTKITGNVSCLITKLTGVMGYLITGTPEIIGYLIIGKQEVIGFRITCRNTRGHWMLHHRYARVQGFPTTGTPEIRDSLPQVRQRSGIPYHRYARGQGFLPQVHQRSLDFSSQNTYIVIECFFSGTPCNWIPHHRSTGGL